MNEVIDQLSSFILDEFDIHEFNVEDTGESYLVTIDIIKERKTNK